MSNAGSQSDSADQISGPSGSMSGSSTMSPMERKQNLRDVLTKAQNLQDDKATTIRNLEEVIQRADSICLNATVNEKATCQDEIVMDSQVMMTSSKVLNIVSASLTKDLSPYNLKDFAEMLLSYMGSLPECHSQDADWSMLKNDLMSRFKRTPDFSILSGCLDPVEKQKVERQQRQVVKREALGPMKRPDAVMSVEKQVDSVEQTVEKIKKLISDHCRENGSPISFYRLVLHPNKFGKTIENLLHVSFLVRDKRMRLTVDGDGNLLIGPTSKELIHQAKKSGKKGTVQNVMELNLQQWRRLIDLHKIIEPFIDF